jgi:Na+/melibiose symporter-like transporter
MSRIAAPEDAGGPSLPGAVKVGYGAGSVGIAATEFFVRIYLLKLYTDLLGLSPSLAGTALAVALVGEVMTDPVVGELSDRTRSRAGRRRPWIAAGAVLGAIVFVALFRPPSIESQAGLAAWLLGSYLLFSTVMTMLAVPHAALGGELASDPTTRNEVFGWRFLFTNVGLVAGIVLPAAVTGEGGDATAAAPWLGLVVVCGALVAVRATRGRDRPDTSGASFSLRTLLGSLRSVARSRPFRPLLGAYMIGSVALTLNSALALFYYEHRLRLGEREVFLGILLPFALVIALSIGGWVLLSRRVGRRWTAFTGVLVLGVGSSIVYPLLPAGSLLLPMGWGADRGGARGLGLPARRRGRGRRGSRGGGSRGAPGGPLLRRLANGLEAGPGPRSGRGRLRARAHRLRRRRSRAERGGPWRPGLRLRPGGGGALGRRGADLAPLPAHGENAGARPADPRPAATRRRRDPTGRKCARFVVEPGG